MKILSNLKYFARASELCYFSWSRVTLYLCKLFTFALPLEDTHVQRQTKTKTKKKLKYSFRMKFAFEKLNYVLLFLCAAAEFCSNNTTTTKKANTKEKLEHGRNFLRRKAHKIFCKKANDDSNKHKNEHKVVKQIGDITIHLMLLIHWNEIKKLFLLLALQKLLFSLCKGKVFNLFAKKFFFTF